MFCGIIKRIEGVNGELIMLDGEVYRAKSDGSVEVAPDDETQSEDIKKVETNE